MDGDSQPSSIRLQVRVSPNARRNEVTGFSEGVLFIKVAAPPDRGKANKELISYLSRRLGISRSSLHLLKGSASRNKVISVDGLSRAEIMERLSV